MNHPENPGRGDVRRAWIIGLVPVGLLAGVLLLPPIPQDPAYHALADGRGFIGIPNFLNIATNLAFLAVGVMGIVLCARRRDATAARWSWLTCFVGVALVSLGSGYYHSAPDNDTLVWDRLPMSVGFMGLFVGLLSDHVGQRLERYLLAPAILFGIASVVYWHHTDDLRLYAWVQFAPLFTIPVVLLLFDSPYAHRGYLLVALAIYVAAKLAEHFDGAVFTATGAIVSGHSLKHLLAALALYVVYLMLKRRSPRLSG